ncbi:hypothetical protein [Methylobacterium sp. Leaf111]|uniref:hypothetical protein n=1 Tax=Methylobacterium sp. Leaf111 TaxID=1736257 RepID=UPI000A8802ED|nr:hypothetical protein [Methylobacterium sp. Leaf111]
MMLVLLTACAILGFFSFLDLFRGEWGSVVTKDARITLGVSAYLFANTIIYEEGGLTAATLVTLLGWLINDAVQLPRPLRGSDFADSFMGWGAAILSG